MGRNQVQNHHNVASHGLSGHFPPPAYKIKAAFHREIWSADEVVPDLGPPALPRIGGRGWTLLNFDPSRVAPPLKDEEEEEEEEGKKSKGVLFCQSVSKLVGRSDRNSQTSDDRRTRKNSGHHPPDQLLFSGHVRCTLETFQNCVHPPDTEPICYSDTGYSDKSVSVTVFAVSK